MGCYPEGGWLCDTTIWTVGPLQYLSGERDGNPLWFSTGKDLDELIQTGAFLRLLNQSPPFSYLFTILSSLVAHCSDRVPVYTLWKHPTGITPDTHHSTVRHTCPRQWRRPDSTVPGGAPRIP